jgi:nucleoside-diphosphate-sugar epimerase
VVDSLDGHRLVAGPGAPTVVVLGGTGFLGRHVCAAFAAAGHDVLTVARRPASSLPGVRSLALDLCAVSPPELAGILEAERAAVVVNATGGVWGVTAAQMMRLNVTLVEDLVTAVAGMPCGPRVVHLGSVHEYGMVAGGQAINERTPARPVSPYGTTKLMGTRVVLDSARGGGVNAVVLRIANAIGPGAPPDSLLGRVAAQLIAAARAGERAVFRLSPLRARRDFVDVCDISDAVTAAAAASVSGEAINIGRGEAVSVRLLADKLIAASGVKAEVLEEEPEERDLIRGGDVDWQLADISAARDLLGWTPRRSLDDSVRALWAAVSR